MSNTVAIEIELPGDLPKLTLPAGVNARLQFLLDKQDGGTALSPEEREEAQGLVEMAEFLSLLKLCASRRAG